MAERLRGNVSHIEISAAKGKVNFTTNIGVAHLRDETLLEELLCEALFLLCEALFQAK